MHKTPHTPFVLSALGYALLALVTVGAYGAPLSLSQTPAGSGSREPAPNVVITVDDSGSMDFDYETDAEDNVSESRRKITLLKNSLKAVFGNSKANLGIVPDGRIRLAWQAMHNNGKSPGANSLTPGGTNSIRPFQGDHRDKFAAFVDSLSANSGTPSLEMLRNVYNYAHAAAGKDNPWTSNPGDAKPEYLSCRRMYHVFLTDGAWNGQSKTDDVIASDGKGDSNGTKLPDGVTYNVQATNSRVYRDSFGDGVKNSAATLSDWAFKSWATDLQDGSGSTQSMDNNVRPLVRSRNAETYATSKCTAANNCIALPEYWNPKNNPATWQHVSTYTIGFGVGAVNWPYRKTSPNDRNYYTATDATNIDARVTPADWDYNNKTSNSDGTVGNTYGGDLARLIQGELVWPDVSPDNFDGRPSTDVQSQRAIELWHAAINGRGKYYPVKKPEALTAAFKDILNSIFIDTSRPLVSIAANSSYLTSGLKICTAGFDSSNYSGSLSARPTDATTGSILPTEDWNAAKQLDALSNTDIASRLVVSNNGTASFDWSVAFDKLPKSQKDNLKLNNKGDPDEDSVGAARQAFIRGDRSQELVNGGTFRNRDSRLGDIVNSNIWYVGKPASGYTDSTYIKFRSTDGGMGNRAAMVYVGANDGMLHGFNATTGDEKVAYIPAGIASSDLRKLSYPDYVHQYFVDGSPFTGDVDFSKDGVSNWKKLLVGTLGAGGKGYFVLDVTDPGKFTAENAPNLALMDTTSSSDADLGNMISPPVMDDAVANKSRQIVKLNNNRWAAVLGNGVNSTNEAPVLIIQYLDGDKSIKKVSPCGIPVQAICAFKGSNGLSAPQLIDLNGDGKADVAYAGDIKGNLWKFDLGSVKDTDWTTAFKKQPYFVAKRGSTPQAITTAPFWMAHPQGGVMVSFGTGQNLTDADPNDAGTQSYFAVWDNSTYAWSTEKGVTLTDAASTINTPADPALTKLQQQTISSTPTVVDGVNYYDSTKTRFAFGTDTGQNMGWYLDWPISKQRVLMNTRLFAGQKILVQSTIPRSGASTTIETCNPATSSERNFTSVLNMLYGSNADSAPFASLDANHVNILANASTVEVKGGDTILVRTANKLKVASANCPIGTTCPTQDFRTGSSVGVRAGWRQISR